MKKFVLFTVLVLALSIILVPTICFADAAGSYSLTQVAITMTEPAFNKVVPTDAKASNSNISVSNIVWKDSNGKVIANTDKFTSGGTYTVSFDLIRNAGDIFAARTSVYINNSAEGINKTFVSTSKLNISKSYTIQGGRLSNASGKAQYMEDGPASTATTAEGKKIMGYLNILVDGTVEEGKALPTSFQANSDLNKTYTKYSIYSETPKDTTKPYAVWQPYASKAEGGKTYNLRVIVPIPENCELADDFKATIDGHTVQKAGFAGNLILDYKYVVGETTPAAAIVKTVTEVLFDDYAFPVAGQEYDPSKVKLQKDFPGTISKSNFVMFNKTIDGDASLNDKVSLEVTVKLNSSYEFSSSPKATLGGTDADSFVKVSASEYKFVYQLQIKEGTSFKITEQSPETVEYKDGEKVELFVKAEGEIESYQWRLEKANTSSSGGPKQKYEKTSIDGATKDTYVIEKATKDMDGYVYNCRITGKDKSVIYSADITLKLVEEEKPAEEAKVSGEEVKASGEETKEEPKEEPKEETKPEEVEKIVWSEASEWALDELNSANNMGLIPMIFNKESLKSNITRKEFAHVAVKLYEKIAGKKATKASKNPFTDTKDEEVLKAYKIGITEGTSETTFSPDKQITREQMATMVKRALAKAGIKTDVDLNKVKKFSDDNLMHDWSRDAIYFMSEAGIIKGVSTTENRYGVTGTATREQALLISVRSANAFAKK